MRIEQKTFKAVRDAQKILAEYIVPDSGVSDREAINRLLGVLDNRELVKEMKEHETKTVDENLVEKIAKMAEASTGIYTPEFSERDVEIMEKTRANIGESIRHNFGNKK